MKIVVLDGYTLNPGDNPWDALAALGDLTVHDRSAPDETVPRARGAAIVLTNKTHLDAATLAALPDLRYVGVLATGYNVVDIAAARAHGITVTNVPEYGTDFVAQHVFALLLELTNAVGEHDAAVHAGEWQRCPDFSFWKRPLLELAGLTMGIVGYGRIGRRVGDVARALGMRVLASVRPGTAAPAATATETWCDLETLFATSDVVSLHCPLTSDNTRFVNAALLARMKRSALLVNTARGPLIDEQALAEALAAGTIAGAGLDVVSVEPIRADNPLLRAPNCVLTPHVAWASLAARRRLMATAVDNVRGFLAGKPQNVVR
ncbi:D-2-hydroxyacid dehydrogenase [Candidatus Binatia bacterium]|nr:D-2-hydroxyacid dehydrogenase [Candidatus Binatia bacterium]